MLANALLLALHQRRLGRGCGVPPEVLEILYYSYVDPNNSLRRLCHAQNLRTLEHWHRTGGIHVSHSHLLEVWCASCRHGHLAVAQWLRQAFHLTVDDARTAGALTMAIRWALLPVLHWLQHTFGFAKLDGCVHLRLACCSDRVDVLAWLCACFQITVADVRAERAFALACEQGYLKAAAWLHHTYHLTLADACDKHCWVLCHACVNAHMIVAPNVWIPESRRPRSPID